MKDYRGFTLVEMLMVILVVAILAGIGISQFVDFAGDAKQAVTKDRLNQIKTAIVGDPRLVSGGVYTQPGFLGHCGAVPSVLDDLVSMPASGNCAIPYDPMTRVGWRGPYLSTASGDWNLDAWGTLIQYDSLFRTLTSCGPNLGCGDVDDISVSF
jgi:prepilin-type N-terminal cleavage/methylation domain-containing protein